MRLSREQFERYRKQLSLPGMSEDAQRRLLAGRVTVLGINSWGAFAARFLIETGIGTVVAVDDSVERLKQLKDSLDHLLSKNPDVSLQLRTWRYDASEAEALFADADVLVDGFDNWQHKISTSDICMQRKKSLIHAGGNGFRFQIYAMVPPRSACLRCVLPEVGIDDPPIGSPDTFTLSPVAAMLGGLQAFEAIKLVGRLGATQGNELWKFDLLSGELETIHGLDPRADCPDCGQYSR